MALDVSNFIVKQPDWSGITHAADQLERNRYRDQELQNQKNIRKQAGLTYFNNAIDEKALHTGTAVDPLITTGISQAKQQAYKMFEAGADAPTVMMATAPLLSKINRYSSVAQTVNKQADDTIAKLKADGHVGYDLDKLKDEALKSALYDADPKTGQLTLNPDKADPNTNYVLQTIKDNPEKVTNTEAFDQFADKSKTNKTLSDVTQYTPTGGSTKMRAHLIAPDWAVPETDAKGVTTGFVPKHDIALEQGQPLIHNFKDAQGNETKAPVRLLDEKIFDQGMTPAMQDYIRGQVKQHLQEYQTKGGDEIPLNSPKAKLIGRAIAYDMLNTPTRLPHSIESAEIQGKPSPQEIKLNIGGSPDKLAELSKFEQAQKLKGAYSVPGAGKAVKTNAVEAIGKVFNNDPTFTSGETTNVDGKSVIDVTPFMPGGGLKHGRGDDDKFGSIYYDPKERSLLVERNGKDAQGVKTSEMQHIPEKNAGQFMMRIAEANGVRPEVAAETISKMGYKNGQFTQAAQSGAAVQRVQKAGEEQAAATEKDTTQKVDKALDTDTEPALNQLKGLQTKDGVINKVERRGISTWVGRDRYSVELNTPDGKTKTVTFSDKPALQTYLKQQKAGKSAANVEDLRKKYNY